jgi:hypothetical protein
MKGSTVDYNQIFLFLGSVAVILIAGSLVYLVENIYSQTLLLIAYILLILGGVATYNGYYIGGIPILLGCLLLTGWAMPEEDPAHVFVITFAGRKTSKISRRIALLLKFGKKNAIVGAVPIKIVLVNEDIKLKKQVKCQDEGGYIEGHYSLGWIPDDTDDPRGTPRRKTAGQKLSNFNDVGGAEAIKGHLDDILNVWTQEYANNHTSLQMETQTEQIVTDLLPRINGLIGTGVDPRTGRTLGQITGRRPLGGNPETDDARGLGIRIEKFQPVLRPPQSVIDARIRIAKEVEERKARIKDTETINMQMAMRSRLYREGQKDEDGNVIAQPDPRPKTLAQVREEIVQDRAQDDGKLTVVINKGGQTYTQANPAAGGN